MNILQGTLTENAEIVEIVKQNVKNAPPWVELNYSTEMSEHAACQLRLKDCPPIEKLKKGTLVRIFYDHGYGIGGHVARVTLTSGLIGRWPSRKEIIEWVESFPLDSDFDNADLPGAFKLKKKMADNLRKPLPPLS